MVNSTKYPELTERERFPILSESGRKLLYRMRQHPNAPIWNWPNGEQLDEEGLKKVQSFAKSLSEASNHPGVGKPHWVDDYTRRCLREVPFYRQRTSAETRFEDLPTYRRADLAPRVWDFVPDDQSLDQLIVFSSSGTTGYPTRTPHHPFSAACGIPLIEFALRKLHGIDLLQGSENVAITNIAAYPGAFTTAIVVAYLKEAGCVRVNLDPSAWRHTSDRFRFINEWKAPIWLGDPIAYGAIEKLPIDHTPRAIISSIMHLSDSYSARLSDRYGCPVLDLYAMTEAGIIAVRTEYGHRVLPHDMYVEILDENDQVCPPNVRGEITLTGGRNPFLSLLRYRTGDFASLAVVDGHRVLVGLEGRQPVEYQTAKGRIIHSMEVTRIMRRYPVLRYAVKSRSQVDHELEYEGTVDELALKAELADLFEQRVEVLRVGS